MNDLKLGDIVDVISGNFKGGTGMLQGLPDEYTSHAYIQMGGKFCQIETIECLKRHEGIIYRSVSMDDLNENDDLWYIEKEEAYKDAKERSKGVYKLTYGVWKCEYRNGDWDYDLVAVGSYGKLFVEEKPKYPEVTAPKIAIDLRNVYEDKSLVDLINDGNAVAFIDDRKIFKIHDDKEFDNDGLDIYQIEFHAGSGETWTYGGDDLVMVNFKE